MPKTKTKEPPFTLGTPEEPEDEGKKDQVLAALGETPQGRDRRHLQTMSAEVLIGQAIQKNVPVETMERLLAMRRELKAEWAREEYNRAMAAFQSECPTIKKTKEVKTNSGKVAYRYAPIESIVEQVKPYLQQYGFSYATTMELVEGGVKVVCRVTHEAGHSEESPMQIPLGNKTDIMSNSQVAAAATTFAKRYAFCNAFGILTGDEDNDAQEPPQKSPVATQGRQGATNPTQQASKPPVSPEEAQKLQIVNQLITLGRNAVDKAGYEIAVVDLTQLELVPENYQEINSRLAILIQERKAA